PCLAPVPYTTLFRSNRRGSRDRPVAVLCVGPERHRSAGGAGRAGGRGARPRPRGEVRGGTDARAGGGLSHVRRLPDGLSPPPARDRKSTRLNSSHVK